MDMLPLLQFCGFACTGLQGLVSLLVILYLGSVFGRITMEKAESLLRSWADNNSYAILHQEPRTSGPSTLKYRDPSVFHVMVEDQQGRRRVAWVRCGGLSSRAKPGWVKVRWEEGDWEFPAPGQPTPPNPQDDPMWDRWVDS